MSSKGKSSKQKTKVQDDATASASSDSKNTPTDESEQNVENAMDQFERELHWCIDQLELGLETQKTDSKRAQESIKVLKILTSSKAPMIKKRQAMRNTFGDYRKKMQEVEKKSSAAAKKIKLSEIEMSEMQKSQFFKKSSSKNKNKNQSEGKLKNVTDIDNCFEFKFSIGETNGKDSETNTKDCEANKTENSTSDDKCNSAHIPGTESASSKQFSFVKSSNDFKFDFTVPDGT